MLALVCILRLSKENWIILIEFSGSKFRRAGGFPSSRHLAALTKVNVVISSPFAVHLVDKEAGRGFEKQAEDGHSCAEVKQVLCSFCCQIGQRVKDPKVDDVGQYRHHHPH